MAEDGALPAKVAEEMVRMTAKVEELVRQRGREFFRAAPVDQRVGSRGSMVLHWARSAAEKGESFRGFLLRWPPRVGSLRSCRR